MLIQGKMLSYGNDLSEAFEIRRKVFVEEQHILEELEFDKYDDEAMHVIVYEESNNKNAVATGRIIYDGEECKIGRIAVLKEYRGKKYGDFTVRMLLNKAFIAGIQEVTLEAQVEAIEFYRKIGFKVIGEIYMEVGIPHCKMIIRDQDVITNCNRLSNN